jgi:hypothetical protein
LERGAQGGTTVLGPLDRSSSPLSGIAGAIWTAREISIVGLCLHSP